MKELEFIISMGGTIIGLAITGLTFLVKLIKNAKAKRAMEQIIEIGNAVLPFIREAEKFTSYTGEEKKAYVMTKANQFAITNHITFDEEQVSGKIEELVALTRQVNAKSSVTEETQKEPEDVKKDQSWL
jgi:hypothetical protein